jgi:ABC-type phosphate transport system permease subunit
MNRRPKLSIVAPAASPAEAAAIVAALERFMRETAPQLAGEPERRSAWQQAALREGVARSLEPLSAWA